MDIDTNDDNRFRYSYFYKHRDTIIYCEACGSYTNVFYVCHEPERLAYRICIVEEKLGTGNIIRCHESYIINITCILAVEQCGHCMNLRIITDNVKIPVSKYYQKQVTDLFYKTNLRLF